MTVPMPAYRNGEHMIETVLPVLHDMMQALRPVL